MPSDLLPTNKPNQGSSQHCTLSTTSSASPQPEACQLRLREWTDRVNAALERFLPASDLAPMTLHQAIRYASFNGGKRLRPLLVYATGQLLGATLEQLDPAACAVELIHSYSLIHDDLPAMDNDDLRRGQPSCHKAFDEATAILAGDTMQCLAFQCLAAPITGVSSEQNRQMILCLSEASGSFGMAGGQAMDLAAEGCTLTENEIETNHRLKTGSLIAASIKLGVITANCQDQYIQTGLDTFANHIGLAFQIQDDILDIEGSTQTLGKTQGNDLQLDKATYPRVVGLTEAKRLASLHLEQALAGLSRLPSHYDLHLLQFLGECMVRRTT